MSKYVGFRLGKVHESHVISEYYCGGCGWPVTDHDSFCPECGVAFRECDASNLEAENAKLREDMEDLEGYDQMLRDRLRQETELRVKAEAENAKLRELVDYMAPIALYAASERERDRMRELGVEVGP